MPAHGAIPLGTEGKKAARLLALPAADGCVVYTMVSMCLAASPYSYLTLQKTAIGKKHRMSCPALVFSPTPSL